MRALVIGFPKAGTSTIHRALSESGFSPIHQRKDGIYAGILIERNFLNGCPLFDGLNDCDAVTQMDACHPDHDRNCWPQLNLELLARVNSDHPGCVLILNTRDINEQIASIGNWGDLQCRLTRSEVPGLPRAHGSTSRDLKDWINWHYERLEASNIRYSTVKVDAPDAKAQLETAIGQQVKWWGRGNQTRV